MSREFEAAYKMARQMQDDMRDLRRAVYELSRDAFIEGVVSSSSWVTQEMAEDMWMDSNARERVKERYEP